jgi:hypothetical protein
MTTINSKTWVVAFCSIFFIAATTDARGWRGIVPLHSTRSQVEQLLGPPTEQNTSNSVVYRTSNETVLIYYANGRSCGIGEKYSRWRVGTDTVTKIYLTPHPGSPLSRLSIDESKYQKFIVGHLSETRYISAREGEALTVVGNEIRSISYFPATDDSNLECPGFPQPNNSNCEYIPDAFDSLGDMGFAQEKLFLDNFFIALVESKAKSYIIAYGGKRARPDEAKKRAARAKQYLVAVRHFPSDHIKVIDGGYREKRALELYVVSEGVCPPIPFPTVDARDVEIIASRRKTLNHGQERNAGPR